MIASVNCERCGYPLPSLTSPMQKIKVVVDDYTRPILEAARRAREEVAAWPAWKANECRCATLEGT